MAEIYHDSVNISNDVECLLPFWVDTDRFNNENSEIMLYFFGTEFNPEKSVPFHKHPTKSHRHKFVFAGWNGGGGGNPNAYLRVDNRTEAEGEGRGGRSEKTTFGDYDTTANKSVAAADVIVQNNNNPRRGYLNKMKIYINGNDETAEIEGYLNSEAGGEWGEEDLGNGESGHPINSPDGLSLGTEFGIPLINFPGGSLISPNNNGGRNVIRFAHPSEGGGMLHYVLKIIYSN